MIDPQTTLDLINYRLFDNLGSTGLWSSYITPSLDIYGDNVNTSLYSSPSNITLVQSNYANTTQVFFEFGDLQKGEQDFVIPSTQQIAVDDKIVFNNINYKVKMTKDYYLGSTLLLRAVRCVELL